MDVRWTCVTLDGGPSDGEDPSEVSRISSSETGRIRIFPGAPRVPFIIIVLVGGGPVLRMGVP